MWVIEANIFNLSLYFSNYVEFVGIANNNRMERNNSEIIMLEKKCACLQIWNRMAKSYAYFDHIQVKWVKKMIT